MVTSSLSHCLLRARRPAFAALAFWLALVPVTAHPAPQVVADIPPVHSIVARVMQGAGEPELIVPAGTSPHAHSLRPSGARVLQGADLVVWIGPALTPWLAGPLDALAPDARRIEILDLDGLRRMPRRESGEHGGEDAHDHTGHDHGHSHEPGDTDAHVWLDPGNAAVIADAVATALAAADPQNAGTYFENAAAFRLELAELEAGTAARLAPARDRPYVVFHDAYRYFETAFDIPAAGSIALSEADRPGAARLAAIRDHIAASGIVCIFAEPQFPPALAETAAEGTGARVAILDPLGATLTPGAGLYPALIGGLARDMAACLATTPD